MEAMWDHFKSGMIVVAGLLVFFELLNGLILGFDSFTLLGMVKHGGYIALYIIFTLLPSYIFTIHKNQFVNDLSFACILTFLVVAWVYL